MRWRRLFRVKRTIISFTVVALVIAVGLAQPRDLSARPSQAQGITFHAPVEMDTYMVQGILDQNYGHETSLRAGAFGESEHITLIKFGFPPELGKASTIQSARMRLFCLEMVSKHSPAPRIDLSLANGDWDESDQSTYRRKPNKTGGVRGWPVGDCKNEWTVWIDVTDWVQAWYNDYIGADDGLRNRGFYLGPIDASKPDLWRFHSREDTPAWPAGRQPELEIVALPPVTPTPTPTDTPTPTETPIPTDTPTPTQTPIPTDTPTITNTPEATATPTATNTPEPPPDIYLPLVMHSFTLHAAPVVPGETPPALGARPGVIDRLRPPR
jgi:hypothetical protein